jgi:hypothetical protein
VENKTMEKRNSTSVGKLNIGDVNYLHLTLGDNNRSTQTNGIDNEGLITILSDIQTRLSNSETRHDSALTEIEAAIQSRDDEGFFTKTLKALQTVKDIANTSGDLYTLTTQGIAQVQTLLGGIT